MVGVEKKYLKLTKAKYGKFTTGFKLPRTLGNKVISWLSMSDSRFISILYHYTLCYNSTAFWLYFCSAWYPNVNKIFKSKLQIIQNKCIRFCLQLNSRSHIGVKEFEQLKCSLFPKDLINAFVLFLLNF